jgi:gamma-glutamyl:cysteine ligase YbdK (ATP-grasp superfamily)
MGEDIATSVFSEEDFAANKTRLGEETALLARWFAEHRFSTHEPIGGFEVEAWLVDDRSVPAPINETFLAALDSPLVVPELSVFNVEINTPPQALHGAALSIMHQNLKQTWERCNRVAATLGAELIAIGILPTARDRDLTLRHMSQRERYRALNEQVLRMRHGRPITLDIHGRDHLRTTHADVMLEAAATSFQIHLQVVQKRAARVFNAATVLSAPMVAVSANSPFLFGRDLWDETRIPLFEQSVAVAQTAQAKRNRVTFGHGYVERSLMECFEENLATYAVLLPEVLEDIPEKLAHLRLHNGTIWRWNRPLIGFDENGTPHLRLEHRVAPAGPSMVDMVANAGLFFGLIDALSGARTAPESQLSFEQARSNFYAAAREGLRAQIVWLDGKVRPVRELILQELLPLARKGLERLDIRAQDIDLYLGIIEGRLQSGQNGAAWQRAWTERHGLDRKLLTRAYRDRSASGAPVHEWSL